MNNLTTRKRSTRFLAFAMMLVMLTALMCPFALAATLDDYLAGDAAWGDVDKESAIQHYINAGNIKRKSIPESMQTADPTKQQAGYDKKLNFDGTDYYFNAKGFAQLDSLARNHADAERAKKQVDNVAAGFGVVPDINGAGAALDGLIGPLSLVIGIVCVVVMVAMTALTACDLLYLTVPFFREKSDAAVQNSGGRGGVATTSKKTGELKPRWITDEAYYSVRQSIEANYAKNPLTTYLGRRIWAFIALGVVIYILFTGNITLIVSFVINIVSSMMGGLQGLA